MLELCELCLWIQEAHNVGVFELVFGGFAIQDLIDQGWIVLLLHALYVGRCEPMQELLLGNVREYLLEEVDMHLSGGGLSFQHLWELTLQHTTIQCVEHVTFDFHIIRYMPTSWTLVLHVWFKMLNANVILAQVFSCSSPSNMAIWMRFRSSWRLLKCVPIIAWQCA